MLPLLDGEEIQGSPTIVTYICPYNGPIRGDLTVTNYRLFFQSCDANCPLMFDVPLGMVSQFRFFQLPCRNKRHDCESTPKNS
jgi:myotubularin-related protein 1/2